MKNIAAIAISILLLSACSPQPESAVIPANEEIKRLDSSVASAKVSVEYIKRLSDNETIRGLRIPYGGNVLTGRADDVRCLLYVNDAIKTSQIICPDSSERHPREVVENGENELTK